MNRFVVTSAQVQRTKTITYIPENSTKSMNVINKEPAKTDHFDIHLISRILLI